MGGLSGVRVTDPGAAPPVPARRPSPPPHRIASPQPLLEPARTGGPPHEHARGAHARGAAAAAAAVAAILSRPEDGAFGHPPAGTAGLNHPIQPSESAIRLACRVGHSIIVAISK